MGKSIDQYRKEDGYYSEDNCYYETAAEFVQISQFGFCGCGDPEENLEFIMKGLQHIDKPKPEDRFEFGQWFDAWVKEGRELFGNERSRYFFFYWADREGLTEHGGSVPGWLTERGKTVLSDLIEIVKEAKLRGGNDDQSQMEALYGREKSCPDCPYEGQDCCHCAGDELERRNRERKRVEKA